jgi:hypothetical protein
VRAWRERTADERLALVERYVETAGLTVAETVRAVPALDPLYAVVG